MLRKTSAFGFTLFALLFGFGLAARSGATTVQAAGGYLETSGGSTAYYLSANDAKQTGTVSMTTGTAHYYGFLSSVSVSADKLTISYTANAVLNGAPASITGTLTRASLTSAWVASDAVTQNGSLVYSSTATLKGNVYLL